MPVRRVALGPATYLPSEGFVVVPIVPPHRLPDTTVARSALVGYVDGVPKAYANLCRHLAIALDYGDGDVSDEGDHEFVRCRRHGAVFAARDGMCVAGPCLGLALWPLTIEIGPFGEAALVLGDEPSEPR